MSELLPCPFCGSDDVRIADVCSMTFIGNCMNCGASCGCTDTEEEAITAWNTRAEIVTVVTGITTVTDAPQITYVPERTCKVIEMHEHVTMDEPDIAELSCGHDIMVFDMEPPNYCPNCGCKVVS